MNLQEIESVMLLMRSHGCTHFKNLEMEVTLEPLSGALPEMSKVSLPTQMGPAHGGAAPPKEMEIPHHINEVASLLKLGDEALVDKLFPDYTTHAGDE